METFRLLKSYMQFMGLTKLGLNYTDWIFSIISNCIFFLIFGIHSCATFSFFIFKAQTFREYAESFFYFSYALLELSWYALNFLHRDKYDDIFDQLNTIIAKSKFRFFLIFFSALNSESNDIVQYAGQGFSELFFEQWSVRPIRRASFAYSSHRIIFIHNSNGPWRRHLSGTIHNHFFHILTATKYLYFICNLFWIMLNENHWILLKNHFFIGTGSKSPISNSVYQKTIENVEKLSLKMYSILMLLVASLFVGSANIMAVYKYIASNYSTDTFQQMMPAA